MSFPLCYRVHTVCGYMISFLFHVIHQYFGTALQHIWTLSLPCYALHHSQFSLTSAVPFIRLIPRLSPSTVLRKPNTFAWGRRWITMLIQSIVVQDFISFVAILALSTTWPLTDMTRSPMCSDRYRCGLAVWFHPAILWARGQVLSHKPTQSKTKHLYSNIMWHYLR